MYTAQSRAPISRGDRQGADDRTSPAVQGGMRRSGPQNGVQGTQGGRGGGTRAQRNTANMPQITNRGDEDRDSKTPSSAADLDRHARGAFDEMRELLKGQPPWSREVEFNRQKARNYHQTLIFNHPLHPLAQSLDPIWVRTSYPLIVSFRDHVARAEVALQQLHSGGGNGNNRRPPRNSPQEQEVKKVLTRFRQALASEETFYRQLILRLIKFFGMSTVCSGVLEGVGMTITPADGDDEGGGISNEEKKEKIGLVYKALVCLGDIERYKEQYSDGFRREKMAGGAGGKKGKGDVGVGEERFGRARAYYDVARALLPDDGSAYNQLAVISTYLNDDFSTIYNYFRALAIKVPFKNIGDILEKYLKKVFERSGEPTTEGDENGLEGWKREVGVLVSILYRQNGFSNLPSLKATILPKLSELLLSRHLPSETIVRLTTISIGLHWHTRSLSSMLPVDHTNQPSRTQQAEESSLDFLLCVFIVLITISAGEVEDIINTPGWSNPLESAIVDDEKDTDSELHTSISAILRRILPSLRLISKWVKLHLDYLSRFPTDEPTAELPNGKNRLHTVIPTFWSAYYRLIECLARAFPLGMLPSLEMGLEEDEDMRGFLPLSRGLMGTRRISQEGVEREVHPNEEQLMRIADLQVDATLILQAQTSGLTSIVETRMDRGLEAQMEEDYASVSTETEDDPVNMAMRASLGGHTSEYEEWDQGIQKWDDAYQTRMDEITPPRQAPVQAKATAYDLLHNLVLDSKSPETASPSSNPRLNQATTPSTRAYTSPRVSTNPPVGSTPANGPGNGSPGLLFGGEGIWSMTREESNSQPGLKRDNATHGPQGDQGQVGLGSRPGSEKPKGRISEQGVKAIWDSEPGGTSAFGVGQASGFAGFGGGGGERRISNNGLNAQYQYQQSQLQPQFHSPLEGQTMAQRAGPMDAGQLFAGISGLGGNLWDQQPFSHNVHGVIGRPGVQQYTQGQNYGYGSGQIPGQSQVQGQGQGQSQGNGTGSARNSLGGYAGFSTWG